MERLKLGISNLAWDDKIDTKNLFFILKDNNINFIEIVLPKYIDWKAQDFSKLYIFVNHAISHGLDIKSTQSLFYGTGISSYRTPDFLNHLIRISDICKNINVTHLVLGAPTMRTENTIGLSNIFLRIDPILKQNNQTLLLEPNSRVYKGSYFFKVGEINDFIKTHNLGSIKTMIDTHNILLEEENPSSVFLNNLDNINHVHVSEQNLSGFITSEHHISLAQTLKENKYSGLVVYEAQPSLNLVQDIKMFSKIYNI